VEFIGPVSVAEQGDDPSATAIVDDSPVDRRHKTNWARLIRKVYEVDPLKCLNCGATIPIIAFIDDARYLRGFLYLTNVRSWPKAACQNSGFPAV